MAESYQKKLDRVRRPRVQIKYEVEVGGAMRKEELPFVVGVLANLSGDNAATDIRECQFEAIDRDNIDEKLRNAKPELTMRVKNTLAGDGTELSVSGLKFEKMDDFSPESVAKRVPELNKLLEERNRLNEVLTKMGSNQKLEDLLNKVMSNTNDVQALAKKMGVEAADKPKGE